MHTVYLQISYNGRWHLAGPAHERHLSPSTDALVLLWTGRALRLKYRPAVAFVMRYY